MKFYGCRFAPSIFIYLVETVGLLSILNYYNILSGVISQFVVGVTACVDI